MENFVDVSGRVSASLKSVACGVAKKCFQEMGYKENFEVSVRFVSEKEMITLNTATRNTPRVTDVLSFPAFNLKIGEKIDIDSVECEILKNEDGLIHFGDIAICVIKLKKQAKEFGNTNEEELKKLIIHSMLHLMGYDHIKDEDYLVMQDMENKLSKKIDLSNL